jgi:hypothetical protein
MRSRLEIYSLAVCFAAVVCLIVCAGVGGYSLVEISAPGVTVKRWAFDHHQSNDAYWDWQRSRGPEDARLEPRPSEDVLTKRRLESYDRALTAERREGTQTLIKVTMFIFAATLALWVHWRISQRARDLSRNTLFPGLGGEGE